MCPVSVLDAREEIVEVVCWSGEAGGTKGSE